MIIGLPGSGKTYLGKTMSEKFGGQLIDDITSVDQLPPNTQSLSVVIITDPRFCITSVRDLAIKTLTEKYGSLEQIYFENNINKAIKNIQYRNDGRKVDGFLKYLHKEYQIPQEVTTIDIWQP